jgi:hypothetical protein
LDIYLAGSQNIVRGNQLRSGKRFVDSVESPSFSELFDAWGRYSGAAITGPHPAYRGGTLFAIGGWPLVTAYVTLARFVSALCDFLATETFRKDAAEMDPVERRVIAESRVQ